MNLPPGFQCLLGLKNLSEITIWKSGTNKLWINIILPHIFLEEKQELKGHSAIKA